MQTTCRSHGDTITPPWAARRRSGEGSSGECTAAVRTPRRRQRTARAWKNRIYNRCCCVNRCPIRNRSLINHRRCLHRHRSLSPSRLRNRPRLPPQGRFPPARSFRTKKRSACRRTENVKGGQPQQGDLSSWSTRWARRYSGKRVVCANFDYRTLATTC